MSEKLKLTKIEIETKDGVVISLSIEEVRELYEQLHDLFAKKDAVFLPSTTPAPIIIERDRYPWRPGPCVPYWRSSPSTCETQRDSPPMIVCEVKGNYGIKIGYSGEAA